MGVVTDWIWSHNHARWRMRSSLHYTECPNLCADGSPPPHHPIPIGSEKMQFQNSIVFSGRTHGFIDCPVVPSRFIRFAFYIIFGEALGPFVTNGIDFGGWKRHEMTHGSVNCIFPLFVARMTFFHESLFKFWYSITYSWYCHTFEIISNFMSDHTWLFSTYQCAYDCTNNSTSKLYF